MPRSLLFAWHSLHLEPHSLFFEPCELGGMGREEEGMPHEELFEPLGAGLTAFFPLFGRLEGRGMRREEEGMRLEEQKTRREAWGMPRAEVLEGHEVPFRWEGDGGRRLAGLVARRLVPALFDN